METYQSYTTQTSFPDCERYKEFESLMLGKPYKKRACGKDAVDCWGLIVLFYELCRNININNFFEYEEGKPFDECYKKGITYWTETDEPQKGDMIVSFVGLNPVHVGLWWGYDKILHARDGTFVRIDRIRTMQKLSTMVRYFRYANY